MRVRGVYNFGDVIPGGPDTDCFVSYNVIGMPGGLLTGPYESEHAAIEDMNDIASYEEASGVKLLLRSQIVTGGT